MNLTKARYERRKARKKIIRLITLLSAVIVVCSAFLAVGIRVYNQDASLQNKRDGQTVGNHGAKAEENEVPEADERQSEERVILPEPVSAVEIEGQGEVLAEEPLAEEPLAVEEILHFVDAWGEWHDAVIDPTVPRHSYNWDCLQREDMDVSYVGDPFYSIRKGIDVSYHQGSIDWSKVKADGYEFVFIRIGYRGYGTAGTLKEDTEFAVNLANAQKAGLDVGVYFFSQAVNEAEALEEAQFVINLLSGATLQLPVVYDPELIRDNDARTDDVTGEQFTANTIVFCEEIKKAGFEPMIYSNMVWEGFLFDMKQLENYMVWYADYEQIPQTPYHFSFWQYSEKGRVSGIGGIVDLDVQFMENQQ